ncbi:serine protease inhibitor 77Ba-like [Pieris rapae]|uniref:serine protease inhibitor 77Ba-like n=1 Tax=Pieris rapae TaxID=64459 RepID=UPI001E27FC1A|nr:serine protease inhibitor 77Ba-like [Pieris rapae]
MIFILFLSIICPLLCYGCQFHCSRDFAMVSLKRPTYDFSVRILDRVSQETGGHFVFSPISTWLQLMTLAEGAKGPTADEIWKVTRYHRRKCFRRKYREIFNLMDEELLPMTKRSSTIVVNKLLNVKKKFTNEVMKSKETRVLSIDFYDTVGAAEKVNDIIKTNMDQVIEEGLYQDDFNLTVLLFVDTAYFRSDWQAPFNPVYTSRESFYSEENKRIGEVKLMTQIGYFNVTDVSYVNARVLELPFSLEGRVSILILLPMEGSVKDMYYKLKDIRLTTIYSLFKLTGPVLVSVKLPRFKITTNLVNIPELLYDMGVKRVFYPNLADLSGISDYMTHASIMTQISDIEITEKGVNASSMAESLISNPYTKEEFVANRPFAYLIVDRKTDIILFAGMYSNPSIY